MNASREAFDLRNPHCRLNFRLRFRENWKRWSWWKLVASDTIHHVCPLTK